MHFLHIEGRMRLEWLEDILAVAETGSLVEAADRRYLTQSAFSRRIKAIEDHLGVELFDRSRKPVQLRPTTLEQQQTITRLARDLRQLTRDLQLGQERSSRRLVVVTQHALAAGTAAAILRKLHSSSGNIILSLQSANHGDCFTQLISRQADIAIVYRDVAIEQPVRNDFVEVMNLGLDRLVPVIAAAQRDAMLDKIKAGSLPYIAYPSEVFLGQVMSRHILPSLPEGIRLIERAETALSLACLEMASIGLGMAWVPLSVARSALAAGDLHDLSVDAGLPSCPLHITAVRLASPADALEEAAWHSLRASISQAGPSGPPAT